MDNEKQKKEADGGFSISYEFMRRWGRLANPNDFKIYVHMLCEYSKSGSVPPPEKLAKQLHMRLDEIEAATDYWTTNGLMLSDGTNVTFPQPDAVSTEITPARAKVNRQKIREELHSSYAPGEISRAIDENAELSDLFSGAERVLGKTLSSSDIEMIYSFYDWLGLPVEVIIMLLGYCAKAGKKSKRYIETVAIDWADRGINTYDAAEELIKRLEGIDANERAVRNVFGIYGRAFTQTEKKYIEKWCADPLFDLDIIEYAYDRTVTRTGKLTYSYMNKIMDNWRAEGLDTLEKIRAANEDYRAKTAAGKTDSAVKKSKFNNYTDENKIDYSKITNKFLDDMLDN